MPLAHLSHLQCCLEREGTLCLREGTEIKQSKYGQATGLYGCTTGELFEWLVTRYGEECFVQIQTSF